MILTGRLEDIVVDDVILLPEVPERLSPFQSAIAVCLFAYWLRVRRGSEGIRFQSDDAGTNTSLWYMAACSVRKRFIGGQNQFNLLKKAFSIILLFILLEGCENDCFFHEV